MYKNLSRAKATVSVAALFILPAIILPVRRTNAQDPLSELRREWRAANYSEILNPLIDYWYGLSDKNNFEVDYMIGTTLWNLSAHREEGCEYLRSMAMQYGDVNQAWYVAKERVILADTLCDDCHMYCKEAAGTKTVFALKQPRQRAVILGALRSQGTAQGAPDFWGTYDMVHDGWKGILRLGPKGGSYQDAGGKNFQVRYRTDGYHITFYVVGLGGESAEGSGGQKFDGYLFTQTKDAIAGVTTWNNHPFGFYAIKAK